MIGIRGSVSTHNGYELGDWEFFQCHVEMLGMDGKESELAEFLREWQIAGYAGMSAEDVVEDMAIIIARLEGAELG